MKSENLSDLLLRDSIPYTLDPERITDMVFEKIPSAHQERTLKMIRIRHWKTLFLAATLLFAIGVCAYAAGGKPVSIFSSGKSLLDPDYHTVEAASRAMEKEGYSPLCPSAFSNGYTFQSGNKIENQILDEENQVLETYNSFELHYQKENDSVSFIQEKYLTETSVSSSQEDRTVKGIHLHYDRSTHKVVPLDYVPTPEEEAAQAAGTLHFGYTEFAPGEEIRVSETQIVTWQIADTHFSLFQINGALSKEALLTMAEELLPENRVS